MGRHLVALAIACAILLLSAPAKARRVELSDEVVVVHKPDRLLLRSHERGTFELTISNTGNRTLGVELLHLHTKEAGASGGDIHPSYLLLEPGESGTANVTVVSFASILGGHGVSDSYVGIEWGPELSRGRVDTSAGGKATLKLPVDDDLTFEVLLIAGVAITLVAILVAFAWHVRGRGGGSRGGARQP